LTCVMSYAASIIIPVLNQVNEYLEQAVRSAAGQSVPCETIVVTSARTGESNRALLRNLNETLTAVTVVQQERPGFGAALNQGLRAASCARVAFLPSDDWLEPDAVEECLRHDADIVSTGRTGYDAAGVKKLSTGRGQALWEEYQRKPDFEAKARYLGYFFLFRKEKVLEAGGVDETIGDSPGIDDYDLIWTMLENGASVAIVEKRLFNYRDHPGDRLTLRDPEDMRATMRRILAKHDLTGKRAEEVLESHARWFGVTIQAVLASDAEPAEPESR